MFPYLCLYAGGFNFQHTDWGYSCTNLNGECLAYWAAKENLFLLYNSKDDPSFFFGCWNTGINPDLVFASEDLNRAPNWTDMLKKFPRSQHRPSLIAVSKNLAPFPSELYKRWNFCKANWELYSLITNQLSQELPSLNSSSIDQTYQDFCNIIFAAAKLSFPFGCRNKHRLCWDANANTSTGFSIGSSGWTN